MIDPKVWTDQEKFNQELRISPRMTPERIALTKEFALHMVSEITEMLNACGTWAMHRKREDMAVNEENVRRQLIDQFKYWMSIAQAWGFTPAELEVTYWRKSATVRQRYSEEFLFRAELPLAIIDLDNVLVDYTEGFYKWLCHPSSAPFHPEYSDNAILLLPGEFLDRAAELAERRAWFSAQSMHVDLREWNHLIHRFRICGAFATMPPVWGAEHLVNKLRELGMEVVGLTSRPIDEYPNLYDDTLSWLTAAKIKLDAIWWGSNKPEKLAQRLPQLTNVALVIDDDLKFIRQYEEHPGIRRIYWLANSSVVQPLGLCTDRVVIAQSLSDIALHVKEEATNGHQ